MRLRSGKEYDPQSDAILKEFMSFSNPLFSMWWNEDVVTIVNAFGNTHGFNTKETQRLYLKCCKDLKIKCQRYLSKEEKNNEHKK